MREYLSPVKCNMIVKRRLQYKCYSNWWLAAIQWHGRVDCSVWQDSTHTLPYPREWRHERI